MSSDPLLGLVQEYWPNAIRIHPYRDRQGQPRHLHVRVNAEDHKNKFKWATVYADGHVAPGRNTHFEVEPLYRYAEAKHALEADPSQELWIGEGERDVDTLCDAGFVAVCQPDGASKPGQRVKWKDKHTEAIRALTPAAINVIADADEPGVVDGWEYRRPPGRDQMGAGGGQRCNRFKRAGAEGGPVRRLR